MSDLSLSNPGQPEQDAPESSIGDFFALLKPRVMSLVVFTGIAGMFVAPGAGDMNWLLAGIAILCLAVNAGAAGAVNMWYDRDIDALMKRTKNRPLPAGRIIPAEALSFAVILSVCSVITMGIALNWVAAAILAFANLFYTLVYTMWLKRRTPQNIVIGGAAGAFPPMIGWAAVTGDVTWMPVILFLIIFLWTPPHFWALSLFASDDYRRARIPMMPEAAGARATKIQMLIYTLLLVPVTLLPWGLGYSGAVYGIAASALGLLFILSAIRVLADRRANGLDRDHKNTKLMFGYSVFYLFALFLALMIDKA